MLLVQVQECSRMECDVGDDHCVLQDGEGAVHSRLAVGDVSPVGI